MDVTPTAHRGPTRLTAETLRPWAREQLEIADQIIDNPGGGLLFATQTIGQVKAALQEFDEERWAPVVAILDRAEDAGVKRAFAEARRLVGEASAKLA
ncbi:MAG TPA: hypothetical protein VF134_06430 [Candidatus Dormibacteraeota bacterium]